MSCSGHQSGTAPAACSGCGAPGCSKCFEQVGDSLFCTDCLLKNLEGAESEAYEMETAATVQDLQGEAKRRIRRNWILTGLFSLVGVPAMTSLFTDDKTISLAVKVFAVPVSGIAAVYLIWASLWGIPVVWRWWKGLFEGKSVVIFSSGMGWLIMIVGFFVIPLEFGYMYGVFGGAIYEYRKTRRIANGIGL